MFPLSSMSILIAAGERDNPGIRLIFPHITTIYPAPLASSTSVTSKSNEGGTPIRFLSSDKES